MPCAGLTLQPHSDPWHNRDLCPFSRSLQWLFSTIDLVGSRGRMADGDGGASTQDQRRARRVPFAARAIVQIVPTETRSKFVNFSERGCFVETPRWLPAGSQVQLSFASFGLVFRCNAIIRHRNEKGL